MPDIVEVIGEDTQIIVQSDTSIVEILTNDVTSPEDIRTAAADLFAVHRLDLQNSNAVRKGGASSSKAYADAVETTISFADLSQVVVGANSGVSGGYYVAASATSPGGFVKAFAPGTQNFHIQTVLRWKAGGASTAFCFIGLDCNTSGHAPVAGDGTAMAFQVGYTGLRSVTMGATLISGGVVNNPPFTLGTAPTVDTDYLITIDGDETWITFMMKKLTVIGDVFNWRVSRAQLAAAGKTVNNIFTYVTDARGASGHRFGSLVASTGSLQPTRTKTVNSQLTEGLDHRNIITTPVGGTSDIMLALPKIYDPRVSSPLVLWAHQSLTGNCIDPWEEPRVQPVTQALLDAGYIIAGTNTTIDGYGSAASLAEYARLYKYMKEHFNTGPFFWYGASMGALDIWNSLGQRNWGTPAAVASVGGALDLRYVYDLGDPFTSALKTAYGIASNGSDYATKTAGSDPNLRSGYSFRAIPARFYTSNSDTTQPSVRQENFAAKIRPYVPEATVVYGSGAHLDPSQYQASDVVAFFEKFRY